MVEYLETLERLLPLDRTISTKRRMTDGKVEAVETTFDHALMALKAYEITRNPRYLEVSDLIFTANQAGTSSPQWNFSKQVRDIPPDADSTAFAMLFFWMRSKLHGEAMPTWLPDLHKSFSRGLEYNDGVLTFLGYRHEHEDSPDPVVNTAIAFLCILGNHKGPETQDILGYLNSQSGAYLSGKMDSRYYPRGIYLALRLAKLEFYFPGALDKPGIINEFLDGFQPRNSLELAMRSVTESYLGRADHAVQANKELNKKRKKNGTWPFGTLYTQRTPRCVYGHERLTTLFAIEALELEQKGPSKAI